MDGFFICSIAEMKKARNKFVLPGLHLKSYKCIKSAESTHTNTKGIATAFKENLMSLKSSNIN